MQQDLAFKGLLPIIRDENAGGQALGAQGDAIDGGELIWPQCPFLSVEGGRGETKVKFDRAVFCGFKFRRGRVKKLPL